MKAECNECDWVGDTLELVCLEDDYDVCPDCGSGDIYILSEGEK